MLTKKTKVKYPSSSFKSIFESISVFFPTVFFWAYIVLAPIIYKTREVLFLTIYFPKIVQIILVLTGMFLMTIGAIIAALGRIGRGFYLAKEEPKLATKWGHAIVRHPEYTMYILCFLGIPLVSLSPYLFVFLIGIPGYVITAKNEEKVLLEEFGDEYKEYMLRVGRFFPRKRKKLKL
jgi:protein-S-isoprenylcysteine O-methyltransferase Ste14